MEVKTLFEIPIYSMSEYEFNRKWNKYKKKLYDSFVSNGHTYESANKGLSLTIFPQNVWKYNQIIGFITISVTNRDVLFNIYKTLDRNIHAISKTKHFIQDMRMMGYHFYVNEENDEEIHRKIRMLLDGLVKNNISKNMFVDFRVFDTVFDNVNIKKIMGSLDLK